MIYYYSFFIFLEHCGSPSENEVLVGNRKYSDGSNKISKSKIRRCGECEGCIRPTSDCGKCSPCKNFLRVGGHRGLKKQASCINRVCTWKTPYFSSQSAVQTQKMDKGISKVDLTKKFNRENKVGNNSEKTNTSMNESDNESDSGNSSGLNFKNRNGTFGITLDPILLIYTCDKCPFTSETRKEGLKHVSEEHEETQIHEMETDDDIQSKTINPNSKQNDEQRSMDIYSISDDEDEITCEFENLVARSTELISARPATTSSSTSEIQNKTSHDGVTEEISVIHENIEVAILEPKYDCKCCGLKFTETELLTHFKSLKTKYDQIIGNNRTSEKENVLEIISDSDEDICDIQEVKNTEKSVDIQNIDIISSDSEGEIDLKNPDNDKQYCNLCDDNFINLKDHIKDVHEVKSHNCDICQMSFQTSSDLINHVSTCLKQFKCDFCEITFSSLFDLDKHKINSHKNNMTAKPHLISLSRRS